MNKEGLRGRTLTLKLKTSGFEVLFDAMLQFWAYELFQEIFLTLFGCKSFLFILLQSLLSLAYITSMYTTGSNSCSDSTKLYLLK